MSPSGKPQQASQPPHTILVVDDVEENVELLESLLSAEGYKVISAYGGESALEAVAKEDPDLVLLDIMMPTMDGYEVCRRIKADSATASIPVVMVTVLDELEDIEKGVEAGTDDFLIKPINRIELLTRVKSLLNVKRIKSELDRMVEYLRTLDKERAEGGSAGGHGGA